MNDIENRLDKFLIKENVIKEYDEYTDETNEANETMKELAKLFGGKFTGDGFTAYPFKRGDDWEVYVNLENFDPIDFYVGVSFYNTGTEMGGEMSFYTEEVTEKMLKDIGKLQKVYYDATQTVINGLGKMGDLDV